MAKGLGISIEQLLDLSTNAKLLNQDSFIVLTYC